MTPMNYIYLALLLVLTSVGSSFITLHLPRLKRYYRHYKTLINGRLQRKRPKRELIDATNYINLMNRIDELEAQMKKREANRKGHVKQIVLEYLKSLQK